MDSSQAGGAGPHRRGKKVVGFSHGDQTIDTQERPRSLVSTLTAAPSPEEIVPTPGHSRRASFSDLADLDKSHLPQLSTELTNELRALLSCVTPPTQHARPRPALRRGDSSVTPQNEPSEPSSGDHQTPQQLRAHQAYERGKRLERREQIRSAQASTQHSRQSSPAPNDCAAGDTLQVPAAYSEAAVETASEDEDEDDGYRLTMAGGRPTREPESDPWQKEASKLVRSHTLKVDTTCCTPPGEVRSEAATPTEELESWEYDAPRPPKMRGGVLGQLLGLYNHATSKSPSGSRKSSFLWDSQQSTPTSSGPPSPSEPVLPTEKPKRPFFSKRNSSTGSLGRLVEASAVGTSPAVSGLGAEVAHRLRERQAAEKASRKRKNGSTSSLFGLGTSKAKQEQARITKHIAETIARHRYLEKLCRALMQYGAPTHRLEEYMKMTARVLEVPAQFLYIPGSMIVSFDDPQTHTASVRLVRVNQGLDLGKLRDVHELYKDVVHDRIGVEEATRRLQEITTRKQKFSKWLLVLVYGFASASVGPFAFGARLIDLPIAFLLGSLVGLLQLHFAPRSELYSNVFEISAAVLTSFLARAFGSINGGNTFCFSALAQSSIALILPGYTVLCASLELQSRSIVAGSVRMVYAIIYSLFLGFGIMIGTAVYGRIDPAATSATTCQSSIRGPYFFPAVPIFTLCLIVINQGKFKQMPTMMVISILGYITNYYSATRFAANTQIANTLGAFAIGVLANLHSRIGKRTENFCLDVWEDRILPLLSRLQVSISTSTSSRPHPLPSLPSSRRSSTAQLEAGEAHPTDPTASATGDEDEKPRSHTTLPTATTAPRKRPRRVGYGLAAAAMLPAIFVQVPSGLAVSGSLVAGLATADRINSTPSEAAATTTLSPAQGSPTVGINSVAFNVSYSVVQVAIGITVGLFLAAVVVYPGGKRRSGLFSF